MDHNIQQYFRQLQRFESDLSRDRETVLLAALLASGLLFVAPLLGWAIVLEGLTLPVPPLLVAVVGVGGLYAAFAVLIGRLQLGLYVALVVTVTFAANVPLTVSAGSAYPGNLGPHIWLFQLPLVLLLILLILHDSYSFQSFTKTEYALGGLILWSALTAIFGPTPRPDVAMFFVLYLFFVFLTFGVVYRSVTEHIISLRGAIAAFLITVFGHALFAGAQFLHHGPFGLTFLGETHRTTTANVINLEEIGLGKYPIGVFISGMAGGNGPFSVLLVLAVPLALAFGIAAHNWRRVGALTAAVYMTIILRFTDKDAARAALLLSFVILVGLWLWTNRDVLEAWHRTRNRLGRMILYAVSLSVSVVVLLVPSERSGLNSINRVS
jgi:hypothetical protein